MKKLEVRLRREPGRERERGCRAAARYRGRTLISTQLLTWKGQVRMR